MRAVLIDIEGTTTPISFVYEVLFPFAGERLEEACSRAAVDPELTAVIERLRREHAEDSIAGASDLPPFGDGSAYARHLMSRDRKSTGLKSLQGLIWKAGYAEGALRGQVFPDVPECLAAWRARGIRLRVFSSGSVLAQKLLFSTTCHGDLTSYFEGFHDTTTGPKQAPESYRKIAAAFALPAAEILFLSDVPGELDAARGAGMGTALLERPGNPGVETHDHARYADFREIQIQGGLPWPAASP